MLSGRGNLSAILVLALGGVGAALQTGVPTPTLPTAFGPAGVGMADVSVPALEGAVAQLGMTVGNAALATSVLLADYFDRDVSPDELSGTMGAMNLLAVPLGGIPMCHGSGGVAGKYAFGARTAGANVVLGLGYALVAVFAVELVAAFPLAVLGVVLVVVAGQLLRTAVGATDEYLIVVGVGVLGLVVNLGVAFVVGLAVQQVRRRWAT
jgi:MFS superfamily sulfate permease-like transporter